MKKTDGKVKKNAVKKAMAVGRYLQSVKSYHQGETWRASFSFSSEPLGPIVERREFEGENAEEVLKKGLLTI